MMVLRVDETVDVVGQAPSRAVVPRHVGRVRIFVGDRTSGESICDAPPRRLRPVRRGLSVHRGVIVGVVFRIAEPHDPSRIERYWSGSGRIAPTSPRSIGSVPGLQCRP